MAELGAISFVMAFYSVQLFIANRGNLMIIDLYLSLSPQSLRQISGKCTIGVHDDFICSLILPMDICNVSKVESLDAWAQYCRPGQEGRTKGLGYRRSLALCAS
jgi:hypothetical protein